MGFSRCRLRPPLANLQCRLGIFLSTTADNSCFSSIGHPSLLLREMTPSRVWRSFMCAVLALASSLLPPTAVGFVSPKVNIAASHRRCTGRRSPPPHMMLPSAEEAAAAGVEQLSQGVLRAGELVGGGAVPPPWAVTLADDVGGGGLLDMDPAKLGLFALGGLGVAAAGFSTAVYWRMQYVVSAVVACGRFNCVLSLRLREKRRRGEHVLVGTAVLVACCMVLGPPFAAPGPAHVPDPR